MKTEAQDWKGLASAGAIVEPLAARGAESLAGYAGTVMVGSPRPHGGGHALTVVAFPAEGGAVVLFARLSDPADARELGLRIRVRGGPGAGTLQGLAAETALVGRILREGMPLRQANGDAAFEALGEYVLGQALNLDGLGGRTAFADVVACPEGGLWRRSLTLEGIASLANAGMADLAERLAADLLSACGDVPDQGHYALFLGDGDALSVPACVRVPAADGDPYELAEVAGPFGADPFEVHDGRIAELGLAVDALLGRRHCLPGAAAKGRGQSPRRPA